MVFKSKHIYTCPNCKSVLASGNLIALKAVCPDCKNLVEIKNASFPDLSSKPYGRDNLKISQMCDNQKDAIKADHSHYFTGIACRHGHIAPRTKKGDCNECAWQQRKRYVGQNQEKVRKIYRAASNRVRAGRKEHLKITGYSQIKTDGSVHAITEAGDAFCGTTAMEGYSNFTAFPVGKIISGAITCKRCLSSMKTCGIETL